MQRLLCRTNQPVVHQRRGFSEQDLFQINTKYGCTGTVCVFSAPFFAAMSLYLKFKPLVSCVWRVKLSYTSVWK